MPYSTLVSPDLLAPHLDSWVVVDCRFDLRNPAAGREAYLTSHIAGAVYADLVTDLSSAPNGQNGRHPLPSVEEMARVFGRLGIGPGTQVVAYDADNMFAARLWWMLRYLGHEAVAVLDGGWDAWCREGHAVRAGEEQKPAATFVPHPRQELHVDLAEVMALTTTGKALLVDARAPERYQGESEPIDRIPGHIPGAVNRFFKQNVNTDGTMRPAEQLREEFGRLFAGTAPDDVVMYCGSGVTACQNLLALEHAGIHGARLFPGSWSQWSADPARPVETGPARAR